MAILTADLIQPIGEIEPDMWADNDPGGSTVARLTAYLAEAVSKTSNVLAQKAWAYYRAYDAQYKKLAGIPSKASPEHDINYEITASQLSRLAALAAEKLAEFEGIVGETVSANNQANQSIAVPSEFVF